MVPPFSFETRVVSSISWICARHPPSRRGPQLMVKRLTYAGFSSNQWKLAHERVSKHTSVPFCHLDADKNFTVLKRQHVGRTRFPKKLPMQPCHPAIGNEPNENLSQSHQFRAFLAPSLYAMAHCALCELLKIVNVHRHNSLKIAHGDFRNCHCERSEESLIVAVGQTKTIIRNVSLRST